MLFYFAQVLSILLGLPWNTVSLGTALPDGTKISTVTKTFQSQYVPNGALRFVSDSGVCETTPGVHQLSGYINVGVNMSMWFWFFEARESPETAPFTLWLNGGPGCSSMVGLLQENGPCTVNPDEKTTTINPYSWNNFSNMIYIDQPIGSGLSFGTQTVNSSMSAATVVWRAFQVLFESGEFSKYRSREFVLAVESYAGHYGPPFAAFFNEQSQLIQEGKLRGEKVAFSTLMMNSGWYDPIINYQAYIDFVTDAPGYGPLQNDTVIEKLKEAFYGPGGCLEQEKKCYAAGDSPASNKICQDSDEFCTQNVRKPAENGYNPFDLRQGPNATFPPTYFIGFLNNSDIRERVGAEVTFRECTRAVHHTFDMTGDGGRTVLPLLAELVDSGLKTLIWAGDTDIECNWLAGHAAVLAMDWYGKERLKYTPLTNITFHGKAVAAVQNVDNFTFAKVYGAGHKLPAYQPETSLEIFRQIINKEPLHSV